MALIDNFGDNPPNDKRVNIHLFAGAILGVIDGDFTRVEAMTFLGLDDTAGNDKDQLDELIAGYQSKPTAVQKLAFIYKIVQYLIGFQHGEISETLLKNLLGLT